MTKVTQTRRKIERHYWAGRPAYNLQVRERENGEESRTIVGHAILFNTPSAALYEDDREVVREVILPEAVPLSLLDSSDIKMTMFHDRQLILGRSNKGAGTLSYTIDDKGVAFEFDAPKTADGDKAIELVKRGDITGCSFAFSTYYNDDDHVTKERTTAPDGRINVTCFVRKIIAVHDFTLTTDPAYPLTDCSAQAARETRQLGNRLKIGEMAERLRESRAQRIAQQINELQKLAAGR